jgi:CRP-like cAMP-binding protein
VLTGGPLGVRMKAETPCRVALVESAEFRRLAFSQPEVHQRVMKQVAPVMSRITGMEQNRERLASLGTMAAGPRTSSTTRRRPPGAPRRRWRRRSR